MSRCLQRGFLSMLVGLAVLACTLHPAGAASPGVTEDTLLVGSNMILTGPAAFWGQGSDHGARAYFEYVNDQGGIHGRKIEFINTDNAYKPVRAVAATKRLIEKEQVLTLMGYQSSACIQAAEQFFTEAGVPLIAPITTGRALVEPPRKYLFVVFSQYRDQAEYLVDHMAQKPQWKSMKIAAIYQDDDFGKDGLEGMEQAAADHAGIDVVAKEAFARGAKDFSSQVVKCKESGADALLISCATSQAAQIIKEAEKLAWKPQFMVLSGAADNKLIELAGSATEGMMAATNVVFPGVTDTPEVVEARKVITKYYPDQPVNIPAIDGYAVAMVTVEALRLAGKEPTREKIVQALEGMREYETGILPPVTFGPNVRQGCEGAFLYRVENGRFTLFE